MSTYYDTLGVEHDASINEIKQAYRQLVLRHHPDKGGDEEQFKKIAEAYECLSDEFHRDQYDQELQMGSNRNMMGMGMGIPEHVMELFKSHLEETLWSSIGRSSPIEISNVEVAMPITLFDVCLGGEKKIDFERLAFVDLMGNTVKLPQLATQLCHQCSGSGSEIKVMQNRFFMQQSVVSCSTCSGEGYMLINNCRLIKRKCRFKHNIPIGILSGEKFVFDNEGDIHYNKKTKQFHQGHVVITVSYDIIGTNRLLYEMYQFPNIVITHVHFGDIYYEYQSSIFEHLVGTKFNLPLSNNRFMLIKVDNLDQPKTIKGFGLPQIVDKSCGAIEIRNIVITFKLQPFDKKISLCEGDKIILRRIMASQFPKVVEQDAILIDYLAPATSHM